MAVVNATANAANKAVVFIQGKSITGVLLQIRVSSNLLGRNWVELGVTGSIGCWLPPVGSGEERTEALHVAATLAFPDELVGTFALDVVEGELGSSEVTQFRTVAYLVDQAQCSIEVLVLANQCLALQQQDV